MDKILIYCDNFNIDSIIEYNSKISHLIIKQNLLSNIDLLQKIFRLKLLNRTLKSILEINLDIQYFNGKQNAANDGNSSLH